MSATATRQSLLPMKLVYFFHGFALAPIFPFLPVMMIQLGLSGAAVGTIGFVSKLCVQLVLTPVGSLVDKFPNKRLFIIRLFLVGELVSVYLFRFVPPVAHDDLRPVRLRCQDDLAVVAECLAGIDPCLHKLGDLRRGAGGGRDPLCQFDCVDREGAGFNFSSRAIISKANVTSDGSLVFNVARGGDGGVACAVARGWCRLNCADDELNTVLNRPEEHHDFSLWTPTFWSSLLLFVGMGIFGMGASSFTDSVCHQVAEAAGEDFGRQRAWMSVGWGCAAVIVGELMDQAGKGGAVVQDYSLAFDVFLVAHAMGILALSFVRVSPANIVKSESGVFTELITSVDKGYSLLFLFFCVVIGACQGALQFQFMLVENLQASKDCDSSHAVKLIQGLVLAINCVGEVPMFIYSGKLIGRFGVGAMTTFVLLLWCLRFLLFGMLSDPWLMLPLEFFGGWCVALAFPIMNAVAAGAAPEGTQATAVTIAMAAYDGIGTSVGGVVAGMLFDRAGSSAMFHLFGMLALAASAVNVAWHRVLRTNVREIKPKSMKID